MSNTVIILASSRSDGNTAEVVHYLQQIAGYDCIDLSDYAFGYYDYDHQNKDDDFIPLMRELIAKYDRFIFATPVYWYSMSAQLKTFFDRFSDLLRIEKELGRKLRNKAMALIYCAYSSDQPKHLELPFVRTADYLGMRFDGYLYTYVAGSELDSEVKKTIENFAQRLQTITNNESD